MDDSKRQSENLVSGFQLPGLALNSWLDWAKVAAIIIVVVAAGLVAVNQFASFLYKNQLAAKPCDLCISLNPEVKECFYSITQTFPDKEGNWIPLHNKTNFTLPKEYSK